MKNNIFNKKKKKTDIDYTFPYLSYVTDYDCLSIPIIVLCDRLLMAICHYHMDHHFFPSPFTVYDVRQLWQNMCKNVWY